MCPLHKQRYQDSVVIILTMLQAGRFVVRILAGARDFSVLQNVLTGRGVHPATCSVGSSLGGEGKRLGHEVNHSPPFSAKVKECSCTCTVSVGLHGVDRGNLCRC
jgi:hypothetical protein